MNDAARGIYRNKATGRELLLFKNMLWGRITPTDIDCFIDFRGRLFVFIEVKHGEAELPVGQRLALERLCDSCQLAGVVSVVLVAYSATHSVPSDILVGCLPVRLVRHNGCWRKPTRPINVLEAVDALVETYVPELQEAAEGERE